MRKSILTGLVFLCGSAAQAATLYVDPAGGNDANAGTRTAPLKNIGRALQLAQDPSNVIHLAPGTYSVSTGESFRWVVTGRTFFVGPDDRGAIIDASTTGNTIKLGENSLADFSGVTLRNLNLAFGEATMAVRNATLVDFNASLRLDAYLRAEDVDVRGSSSFDVQNNSTLDLERVDVDGAWNSDVGDFIRAVGSSNVNASEVYIYDMVVDGFVINLAGGSSLQLEDSGIVDSWGNAGLNSYVEVPVTVRATGLYTNVRVKASRISGSPGIALQGDPRTVIRVDYGGAIVDNLIGVYSMGETYLNDHILARRTTVLRNSLANWRVEGDAARAVIYDGSFRGGTFGVQSYGNAQVMVFDSAFRGVSRPIQFESVDSTAKLGTVGDNLHFHGSATNYVSVTANCKGSEPVHLYVTNSTWIRNTQGADSNGHYESQSIRGVAKGSNYWLKSSTCNLHVD